MGKIPGNSDIAAINSGATICIELVATARRPIPNPSYRLSLGEIDELISKVLAVASINPPDYASALLPEARKYLVEENDALKFG